MNNHHEKRLETIAFKTTNEVKKALAGLSMMSDISQSEYIHDLLELHTKNKGDELNLLAEALGRKVT